MVSLATCKRSNSYPRPHPGSSHLWPIQQHHLGHTLLLIASRQTMVLCTSLSTPVDHLWQRGRCCIGSIDLRVFQSDVAGSDLCMNPPDDLNDQAACYNDTLRGILDKHAPLVTRTILERPQVPWFTEEIQGFKVREKTG